jgi:hypothetical protein
LVEVSAFAVHDLESCVYVSVYSTLPRGLQQADLLVDRVVCPPKNQSVTILGFQSELLKPQAFLKQ